MTYKFFVEKYSRNMIQMSDYAFVVLRVDVWRMNECLDLDL